MTQFSRALHELNIDIICANTGPAKGRIERAEVHWIPAADLPDNDWLKWRK